MCQPACVTGLTVIVFCYLLCAISNSWGYNLNLLDEREYDVNVAPLSNSDTNMLHKLRDNLLNFAAFFRLYNQNIRNSSSSSSSSESMQQDSENVQHVAVTRVKPASESAPLEHYGALSNKFQ